MSNHSFDIAIATEYKNVDLAILVWHFQYWINKNKRLGRNQFEGRSWTYQTLQEITACFPYWTKRQVEKLINKAVENKILRKGNFNKSPFDRTVWYAFENESKFLLSEDLDLEELKDDPSSISPNGEMEISERGNPNRQKVTPIPNTLPNTLPNKDNKSAALPLSESSFGHIASSFFAKLKEVNPKIKTPNLDKWANELRLLSKDSEKGTSVQDIEKVIDFVLRSKPASNGFCWANVILSPAALRKNFPKIWAEMQSQNKKNPEKTANDHKKLATKICSRFKNHKDISQGYNYIEFDNGRTVENCVFGDKDFIDKCLHQLKKRNLSVEGLI